MEDLLKIVEGFIPEDQKADIKAKIDGTLETLTKEKVKETKKELSQKFGVNFFEEDVEKAFNNDKFVKKEVLLQKENELNEKLSTLETLQKELENTKKEKDFTEVKYQLAGKGFNMERIDFVQNILPQEGTVEEKVNALYEKVPEFFTQSKEVKVVTQRVEPTETAPKGKSDFQKYIEQRKK